MNQIIEWNEAHGVPRAEKFLEPDYPEDDLPDELSLTAKEAIALNCLKAAKFQLENLNNNAVFSPATRLQLTNEFIDSAIKALEL
ncbi:hypothetical protein [Cylindrospermum sp. FACHB-282]|uniref:hypothetical protein n=1 Tax=Cylindrospermum sp. FACHB-282 TaxID=2692794 RepID=UPI001687120D|nr:hypothetical protein [Cylindrospermum sp. FACHB-282]MBD2386006.1 hypothetical protein [Cylindrospermum sp. FACHB-282]